MAKQKNSIFQRLQLNHAYGQLVALIFIPISIIAIVGSTLVIHETSASARSQQRHVAIAILSRYEKTAELLSYTVDTAPQFTRRANAILMHMLNEPFLQRAAIVDTQGKIKANIGHQTKLHWPKIDQQGSYFGPIELHHNSVYGIKLKSHNQASTWLLIELDNKPLEIAHYRVLTVMIMTVFITLLLLMMCL
ncbi:MAG: hybrid sensor histidine kinase/response regulator, partial [Acinetobacter sp.]